MPHFIAIGINHQNAPVSLRERVAFSEAALPATLSALRQGVQPSAIGGIASAAMMKQVTRDAQYVQATRDFLGGEAK